MVARRMTLTLHARTQARRRGIAVPLMMAVARAPDEILLDDRGREVRQSEILDEDTGKTYLLRVVVEIDGGDAKVITVYKTSKLAKYRGSR